MLLENFRSAHIAFGGDAVNLGDETGYATADWLDRFYNWYKVESGMHDGKNLHLAYKRMVTVSGDRLIANISLLTILIHSALKSGFLVSLSISLNECYEFFCELEELTDRFKNLSLIISYDNVCSQILPPDFLPALVETLAVKRIGLSFRGSVSFWMEKGVSQSQTIGETVYQIVPDPPDRKRQFWGDYNPCAKRFEFVVSSTGLLYPCTGLMGLESCCIGTICQPLTVVWETIKRHSLNLKQLACQGPDMGELDATQEILQFRSVCEAHRYKVRYEIKDEGRWEHIGQIR